MAGRFCFEQRRTARIRRMKGAFLSAFAAKRIVPKSVHAQLFLVGAGWANGTEDLSA
jgi:hypothetical protein